MVSPGLALAYPSRQSMEGPEAGSAGPTDTLALSPGSQAQHVEGQHCLGPSTSS